MTERPLAPSTLAAYESYRVASGRIQREYAASSPDAPVRLAKSTSNLFRVRDASSSPGLDVSAFSGVLRCRRRGAYR